MDHVAIMKKSWGLTDKIVSGEKKIESRWYQMKCAPWDKIKNDDTVYFKNSGEPVRIKAKVNKVMQFSDLTPDKVEEIFDEYGREDGLEEEKIPEFVSLFKDKRYCLLIFLKDAAEIEPFEINKKGFGSMAAWITLDNIAKIKI